MSRRMRHLQVNRVLIGCWVSVLLLSLVFIDGCTNQRILDQNALSFVIGYDQAEKDKVRGTVVYPVINPFAQEKIQVISAVNHTSKGLRDIYALQVDKTPVSGQLRVSLYNAAVAKKGIIHLLDALYRDPSVGTRLYLGIVEEDCYTLLTKPFKEEGNIGNYLYEMLDHNIREEKVPSSTIHEFLRAYYSEGTDPALPFIGIKGDEPIIKGIALFQKDRMVGWVPSRDGFLMKLIIDNFSNGDYQAEIPADKLTPKSGKKNEKVYIVLDTISSKAKIKVNQLDPPRFQVKINLNARLLEISEQVDLGNPKIVQLLNEEVGKEIRNGLMKLTQKLQKLQVDPMGYGDYYHGNKRHSHHKGENPTKEEWHKLYPKAQIDYEVTVKLLRTGTVD